MEPANGAAEAMLRSAMKGVGQALEARIIVDKVFDADLEARLVVCGGFNAEAEDGPVAAIRGDVEDTANPALAKRVRSVVVDFEPL